MEKPILIQELDKNLEVLKNLKKQAENEVKILDEIQQTKQIANQQKEQIRNQDYQSYRYDISEKNYIIRIHNKSLNYAKNNGIQFWRIYTDSNIYYSVNQYSKRKKLNSEYDLYSMLGMHIRIYDTFDKVPLFDVVPGDLIFVSEWFDIIEGDIFDPWCNSEWVLYNNLQYKNTFQYTKYLENRNILYKIKYVPMTYRHYHRQELFQINSSVELDRKRQLKNFRREKSSIKNFIQVFSKNNEQFHYIMNWLAIFFQTLNKSTMALILIGDTETTDIFINKIIKPIFAYKDEYLCTINDDMLKKKQESILKDRIFYHVDTDNLSNDATNIKSISQLLRQILNTNSRQDNNTKGNLIITASKDSPCLFLKDIYSRCTVFQVKSFDTILSRTKLDYFTLEEYIKNDLDNFARILAEYQRDDKYFYIVENSEKDVLPTMKNGILMTPDLASNIETFIKNVEVKNLLYFHNIQKEDLDLYEELEVNFKENMIAQPLLSRYFNIIYDEIIFIENAHLLEILKEKSYIFNKAPDDKSKYNGKKRYAIVNDDS